MAGSSDSAQKAAQAQQQAEQAAIQGSQAQINAVFDNPQRQNDINDFVNATKAYYNRELDRQKADADRNLTFALARSGLTGGSVQVDKQKQLGENYEKGQLQAEQKALGAGAALQAADQDARARLISLATQGLDATTAAQQASAALRSNLQAGQATANADALGNAFSPLDKFVTDVSDAQQRRLAIKQTNQMYGTPEFYGYGGSRVGSGYVG